MHIDNLETDFPSSSDYPQEMFDPLMPKECIVGCGSAYMKSNRIVRNFFIRRIREAVRLIPDRRFSQTIDLGTGAGFYLPLLAKISDQVHGVDVNPVVSFTESMLNKRGVNNVTLHKADVMRLPFEDRRFDLAFCLSLIEHIQDQDAALKEFRRILQDNGSLILGYPLQNAPQQLFEGLNRRYQRARLRLRLSRAEYRKKLEEIREFAHDHVDDFGGIKQKVERHFAVEEAAVVRLMGFSVYEILHAVPL